jgi:hypothetical protein
MLDCHPSLAVANDTHFIPRVLEKHEPDKIAAAVAGRNPPLSNRIRHGISDYHRFHRLELPSSEVDHAADQSETYAELVEAIYDRYASRRGKPLAGEKTPDYVRRIPLLRGLFPHSRFVHIIRDGRDVALSLRDWANDKKGPGKLERWAEDPIAVSALWWSWQVKSGRKAGRRLGAKGYLEVRYEALVNDPDAELRRLCAFLDIPFRSEMLRFHEGRRKESPGLSAKSAWKPTTPGLRDWRRQMTAIETALFEAIAGPLLRELGFPAETQADQEIGERARSFRSWWRSHLTKRRARDRSRRQNCV